MFSDISRYRSLEDVVTVDADGRRIRSRALRPPDTAPGRFRHTITDADRLDQLAHLYHHQSRNWWHICDANPEFLAPQELVGREPVVTYRFVVTTPPGGAPPWAAMLRALEGQVGVSRAVLNPDDTVLVDFNRLNVTARDLADTIAAAGFTVTRAVQVGRVGKQIVIPPGRAG